MTGRTSCAGRVKSDLEIAVERMQWTLRDVMGFQPVSFSFLELEHPHRTFSTWWRVDQIPSGVRDVNKYPGIHPEYWEANKGMIRTADLMWACREDEYAQWAILLGAFIHTTEKGRSRWWHGSFYERMIDVLKGVRDYLGEKHNVGLWHHACNDVIPVSLNTWYFEEIFKPRKIEDVGTLAGLCTAMWLGTWRLVHVERTPDMEEV